MIRPFALPWPALLATHLAMLFLTAVPALASSLPSADYEVAALDCPLSVPDRPDLELGGGNARRQDDTDWAAGPPNDLKTKFKGGQHFSIFVEVQDDWILICRYHHVLRQRPRLDVEIPVPGYLLRIDFLEIGPVNRNRLLRLWGTYLREKPPRPDQAAPEQAAPGRPAGAR